MWLRRMSAFGLPKLDTIGSIDPFIEICRYRAFQNQVGDYLQPRWPQQHLLTGAVCVWLCFWLAGYAARVEPDQGQPVGARVPH